MDEMATMQQCVTKMKEKDMELNPETCKFVRKTKTKAKPLPTENPKFQPRPIVMQTQKPILKTGDFFEQKQPSGLNAELAEIPAVKFDRKKYKNTQNFDDPHDDFALIKRTQAQLGKEQKNYLKTAKLQPTNHPEMQGETFLGNIVNNNNLYNQRRWKQGPAVVRSSVNLTRAKRAPQVGKKHDLQEIVESKRIKDQRQKMKEQQLQAQGKTKIQARRNAEAIAKAKIAQPVNIEAPVKKTRRRKQNSPAPNTNKVKTRFQARKAAAIRLKELEQAEAERLGRFQERKADTERLAEIERESQHVALRAKANRLEAEGDLLAQELGSNSNLLSNSSNSSKNSWQAYQNYEAAKHMAR